MKPCFFIAEAGVNHNGAEELAYQLIDVAAAAGADAVKFQTFKAAQIVTRQAAQAAYQKKTAEAGSQFEMLQKLELPLPAFKRLADYCKSKNIQFMSTAFDVDSLHYLTQEIGVTALKIPSGEITNGPLLLAYANQGLPMIMSTGMATMGEIETALKVIAFGLTRPGVTPKSLRDCQQLEWASVQPQLRELVTILHCTSEYPAPLGEINLRAMKMLGETFGLNYGYSDHSEGIFVSVLAVACGASVVEKHFTTDKTLPGPDHKASIDPQELKQLLFEIRRAEQVLGQTQKQTQMSEQENKKVARRSVMAAMAIAKGQKISPEMLTVVRPEGGLSPFRYWDILNQPANRTYQEGDFIQWD